MKPYYQDDHCTIYHGDCRDILPSLGMVDVILTDPPYGMNYKSNYRAGVSQFGYIYGDKLYDYELIANLIAMARCAAYVFGRWNNLEQMPTPKSVLVWVKNNWSMGDLNHEYARQWEMCAFYAKENHRWKNGRPQDVIRCDRVGAANMLHPTEKPTSLIIELLSHTQCGNVLDPFMGSGSTLRAAKDLGLKATGIEISEHYAEIAAKRLSQECLDLT